MRYVDQHLGYSFELPEGWQHEELILKPTFFGPNGFVGSAAEVIQIEVGSILPRYQNPVHREQFLAEPGAVISRSHLGHETNVVVMQRPDRCEISAVHAGIQYCVSHPHDAETLRAVEHLKETFSYPTSERAAAAIRGWNDPRKQAIMGALNSDSPEEARRKLAEAGMAPEIEGPRPERSDRTKGQTGRCLGLLSDAEAAYNASDYKRAVACIETALALAKSVSRSEAWDREGFVASAKARLSAALGALGCYEESLQAAEASLEFFDRHSSPYPAEAKRWMMAKLNKAEALSGLGRFDEAICTLEETKRMLALAPENRPYVRKIEERTVVIRSRMKRATRKKPWWTRG